MDNKLGIPSPDISWWMLKIPTVPFVKIRQSFAGTLDKLQIPALTIAGKAMASNTV